jgi:hypothetical protein
MMRPRTWWRSVLNATKKLIGIGQRDELHSQFAVPPEEAGHTLHRPGDFLMKFHGRLAHHFDPPSFLIGA